MVAEDEPRRRLSDELLGLATGVIRGRGKVIQYNRRGSPIGNKGQHGRCSHQNFSDWSGGLCERWTAGIRGGHVLKTKQLINECAKVYQIFIRCVFAGSGKSDS